MKSNFLDRTGPQPLLPRFGRDDMTPELQKAWDASVEVAGEAVFVEVIAGHPAVHEWYMQSFYQDFFFDRHNKMTLDAATKELLKLRLSMLNGCHVCNSFNVRHASDVGYSDEQIANILSPTSEVYSEPELAVLELAEQVALGNPDGYLSAELYERLTRHYSPAQILEMGALAGVLTGWSKFMFVFDLVTREPNCPISRPVRVEENETIV